MTKCPPAEDLERLLDGFCASSAQAVLERHIQDCSSCQARLDAMTDDPGLVAGRPFGERTGERAPARSAGLRRDRLPGTGAAWTLEVRFPPPERLIHTLLASPPTAPVALEDGGAGAAELETFVTIPGLSIRRMIGRGGMGVVYEAVQESLSRVVAVKMLIAGPAVSPSERNRFRREALAIAQLEHPHIVRIYDVGETQGQPYLVMEYLEGLSLADQLNGGPWPPRRAAEFVATLAEAMHDVHGRGIIHRDLKPANILLAADGVPKIADFGLAKLLDTPQDGATYTGQLLGTPSYGAPEQLASGGAASSQAEPDLPASDIYSLGAILYELLTGRAPFRAARPVDALVQALHQDPIAPSRLEPRVPRDLETICLHCLHKLPGAGTPRRAIWPTTCAGISTAVRSRRAPFRASSGSGNGSAVTPRSRPC